MKRILITGGGASGMAAAIAAAREGAFVTVLEHKSAVLNKLRISGNGKCNYSNTVIDPSCYHNREQEGKLARFLSAFGPEEIKAFMASIGITTGERYGGLYPLSMKASDVADALIAEAERLGVQILTQIPDTTVLQTVLQNVPGKDAKERTKLSCQNGSPVEPYDELILATGGCSYTKTGSDGSGYTILRKLGIPYSRVLPALCPALPETEGEAGAFLKKYAGRRIIGTASVYEEGEEHPKEEYTGEIQINADSFSGIPVLNLGREISRITDAGKAAHLVIHPYPPADKVPDFLKNRPQSDTGLNTPAGFRITKTGSFKKAQAVTGGVSLDLLDNDLRLAGNCRTDAHPYIIGELCDVDGICGGYNLHWAFLSGIRAGSAASRGGNNYI